MRIVAALLTVCVFTIAAGELWDCQAGWITILGNVKSASKTETLEECQALCQDGCQAVTWQTQDGGYCNLHEGKFSDAEFLSTTTSLTFNSGHVACYRGAPQSPPVLHPVPDGAWKKFPYGDKAIYTEKDGLPDYNWTLGGQQSESCPAQYRHNCSQTKGGDPDPDFCKCGAPPGTAGNCYECFLLGALADAPMLKSFNNDTTITRRQIIERALSWVVNGFTYDHNDDHKVGAPEGCATDDSPNCPFYDYVSVCQGLVHMAWNGTKLNVTEVDCLDIQPGDHIHRGSHQQLFRRWVDGPGKDKEWVVYQMGGGWGKANAATGKYSTSGSYGVHGCYKRNGIIEE